MAKNRFSSYQNLADILTAVKNKLKISALSDTNVSNPTNGQVLGYNATTQKWENQNGGGSGSGVDWKTQALLNNCNIFMGNFSDSTVSGVTLYSSIGDDTIATLKGTATDNISFDVLARDDSAKIDAFLSDLITLLKTNEFKFLLSSNKDIQDISVVIKTYNNFHDEPYQYIVVPQTEETTLKKSYPIDSSQIEGAYLLSISFIVPNGHAFGGSSDKTTLSFDIIPKGANEEHTKHTYTGESITQRINVLSKMIDDTKTDSTHTWSSYKISSSIDTAKDDLVPWTSFVKYGTKNLLPPPTLTSGSGSGLTWTVLSDYSIKLNGTTNSSKTLTLFNGAIDIHNTFGLYDDAYLKIYCNNKDRAIFGDGVITIGGTFYCYDPSVQGSSFEEYIQFALSTPDYKFFEPVYISEDEHKAYFDELTLYIDIPSGMSFNNDIIYVTVVLDNESDVYGQYAQTNEQLTKVKANKVKNATNGNFASLDSNGNLVDSGHKHSDYLTNVVPVPIANGGTGNSTGYITTGQLSGTTLGTKSTVEGYNNIARGDYAHAEGYTSNAYGNGSHTEGAMTNAIGNNSHAGGYNTEANYDNQTVVGTYNNNKLTSLFEVGNGTSSSFRSNAFEVYNDGTLSTDNGATKHKLGVLQINPTDNTFKTTPGAMWIEG